MSISRFENGAGQAPTLRAWAWVAAAALIALTPAAMAAEKKAAAPAAPDSDRIHITADRLVARLQDRVAEFSGNVQVTQGEAVLHADKVTVYTKDAPKGTDPARPGAESVDRIVATGGVTIRMKDGTAVADQAEYRADKRVVILTGPGTQVTQAGNSIAGSRITLYRDSGRINVDGSDKQPVRAVFVTEEKLIE